MSGADKPGRALPWRPAGRRRSWLVAALAAGLAVASPAAAQNVPQAAPAPAPTAVVGVLDTGINPYHVEFRDPSPRAQRHPSTYLPGFPRSAIALHLSLDEPDYKRAVAADCARVWAKVRPDQLYWFPGTKIVGAARFASAEPIDCPDVGLNPPLLDVNGHGTMTASRAAASSYGACPTCRVVAVQGLSLRSLQWLREQSSWIDVQSHSWGPVVPVWEPTGADNAVLDTTLLNSPAFVREVEAGARAHPTFWASGNGIADRAGLLGHPKLLDPHVTPSALIVGGHDSGHVTPWSGFPPNVVADACSAPAARADHVEVSEEDRSSGTSGATPYVAGSAAQVLIEARRVLRQRSSGVRGGIAAAGRSGAVRSGPLTDGRLTVVEWRDLVLKTADPRPPATPDDGPRCGVVEGEVVRSTPPLRWQDVPAQFPEYLQIGYGAVNRDTVASAVAALRGGRPVPDRTRTDDYFARDAQVRAATYDIWSKP